MLLIRNNRQQHKSHNQRRNKIKPIYEEHEGWLTDTSGMNDISDLPLKAMEYIKKIEAFVGAPIQIISTSPKREDIIFLEKVF